MDRKSIEEEKTAILMKFFDYAESVIQEWIAKYLDINIDELFSGYQDNSDVLGFQSENDNKHYEGYLVVMEFDEEESYVDSDMLEKSEKYKKTCSMLFDAVHHVFPAVVNTVNKNYKEQLKKLRPLFDNTTMSFRLYRINQSAMELQMAVEAKKQLSSFIINRPEEMDEETFKSIKENISKCEKTIEKNTKEILDNEEQECQYLNEKLKKTDRLYIVIDEAEECNPTDESLSRLPIFGLAYQDPDEETLIEKLKKEMNVRD